MERASPNFAHCLRAAAWGDSNPALHALCSIPPRRSLRIALLRHGGIAWRRARSLVAELCSASSLFPSSSQFCEEDGRERKVEWSPANHLRHAKFIALREDRDAKEVVREAPADEA
jgi:hypothetical protein